MSLINNNNTVDMWGESTSRHPVTGIWGASSKNPWGVSLDSSIANTSPNPNTLVTGVGPIQSLSSSRSSIIDSFNPQLDTSSLSGVTTPEIPKAPSFGDKVNRLLDNYSAAVTGGINTAGKVLAGGKETGIGNVLGTISHAAEMIPGVGKFLGPAFAGAGALANLGWGTKYNEENLNKLKNNIASLNGFTSNVGTREEMTSKVLSAPTIQHFAAGDIYSDGWFTDEGKHLFERLGDQQSQGKMHVDKALMANIDSIEDTDFQNNLAHYGKYGGHLFKNGSFIDRLLSTHGSDWTDGIVHINTGGTHEQNPNGGTQLGVDPQGIPNLLEEGEVVWKSKNEQGQPEEYVFSNRLKPSRGMRGKYNLRDTITNADVIKSWEKGFVETPNDPIAKRTFDAKAAELQQDQEQTKAKKEQREQNKMMKEYLAQQMLQQAMQMPSQMPEYAMQEQAIPYACGGRLFTEGGNLDAILGPPSYSLLGDLINIVNKTPQAKTTHRVDDGNIYATGDYLDKNIFYSPNTETYDAGYQKFATDYINDIMLGKNVNTYGRTTPPKLTLGEGKTWVDMNDVNIKPETRQEQMDLMFGKANANSALNVAAANAYRSKQLADLGLNNNAYNAKWYGEMSDDDLAHIKSRMGNKADDPLPPIKNLQDWIIAGKPTEVETKEDVLMDGDTYTPPVNKWSRLRDFPIWASGIGVISDMLGWTNTPDTTTADDYLAALNSVPDVRWDPINGYLPRNYVDTQHLINQFVANQAQKRQYLRDLSGGNRANLEANQAVADKDLIEGMGTAYLKGIEYNDARADAKAKNDMTIDLANQEQSMKAQEANARKAVDRINHYRNYLDYIANKINRAEANRSVNLTNFVNSIRDKASEAFQMNMANANNALYYSIDNDGVIHYKRGFTNLSQAEQDDIKRDAEFLASKQKRIKNKKGK